MTNYINIPYTKEGYQFKSYQNKLIKPAVDMIWKAETGCVRIIITEVDEESFSVKFRYEGSSLAGLSCQECGIIHLNHEYTFVPATPLEAIAIRVVNWDKRFLDEVDGFSFEEWVDKCKELFYTCPKMRT